MMQLWRTNEQLNEYVLNVRKTLLTCRTKTSLSSSSALEADLDFFATAVVSGTGVLSATTPARLAGTTASMEGGDQILCVTSTYCVFWSLWCHSAVLHCSPPRFCGPCRDMRRLAHRSSCGPKRDP